MTFLYFVLAGLVGGVLAGMGMGGGTLTMPILVLILGVGQLTAQFANLIAFLPSGTAALSLHIKNGLVRGDCLLYILPTALLSCAVSSAFATKLDGDVLRRLFGGFLIVVAVASLVAKTFSRAKAKR